MILGMSTFTFTIVHVIISLIGIVAGLVVLVGMFGARWLDGWTAFFLATTVLTSVTGYFFKTKGGVTPAQVVGGISLAVLAVALMALYIRHLVGAWRWIYVITALTALYLNVFVAVVQAFQKLPLLKPLAPTQSEPPFLIAQIVVLVLFVVFGILAVTRFRPGTAMPA